MRKIQALMEQAVSEGVFPGGIVAWGNRKGLVEEVAVGRIRTTPPPPGPVVTPETLFDLASLTKPLVTGALLLLSASEGRLTLSDLVKWHLPESSGSWVGEATIRELLSHSSGLVAWAPLYERIDLSEDSEARKKKLLEEIIALPPAAPKGGKAVYSDFGFMLLGWILENVWKKPLDLLYRERIAGPLGIDGADFLTPASPLEGMIRQGRLFAASTELDPVTGDPLTGIVHDEHCRVLGGVSGHAGLFGTAKAVWLLARPWVGGEFFPRAWLEVFRSRQEGLEWALGWDTPTKGSSSGRLMTPGASIGHLGYAGTSVWIDYGKDRIVVLLTNRVHPVRTNNRIREFRPILHDAVLETFEE